MHLAARSALQSAGSLLAARNIHGAFRVVRHPGSVELKFTSPHGSNLQITREALVQAVESLRAVGFDASRVHLSVFFRNELPAVAA